MKIAFNPSTVAALIAPPNNKDITFDLRGHNIFARGVKFCGTDTNTWRDIKINNVSIGSNTLDLRNGSNTTLTNINGVVTINSTWRPVVDNLTSDSTTSSLSAKQGKVLKSLINGKSDSDHNHDDRYLRLTGGWMSGDINFGGDNKIYWVRNTDSASISFKNDGDGDADSYMSFVTSDNGNEYFRWSHSSGSTNTEWMALRSDGLRVGGTKVSLEGHSHNDLYYTKTEVNNKLNGKSDTGHTHDDRYLKLTGGTISGTIYRNSGGATISGRDHAIIRLTYAPGGSSWNPIACVDTETGTWTLGHLSSGDSDTNFHFCFSTNIDYNAGNNEGNYVTLRNKVGTIALLSDIPNKNSWNYDDRYLKLTGGVLNGQIILPDIDVNTSYTGSIIIGASNTENLGIDGNEIMARNNGKASTLYLNNEGGAVQLGAILRTNSNIAYMGSQSTQDMIKFINNTSDPYGNGIAIGGGGLTIIGSGESSDVVMGLHSSGGDENMIIAGDGNIDFYSNLQNGWKYGKHMYLDTNGFLFTPSYINIGGNENNNSSPDRVWGSNGSDSYLRSYRTSALKVAYASSAGSATSTTKVIVNLHTTNDINYPLVWSNLANTNSVTENQLFKSWEDLYYNPKNKILYTNRYSGNYANLILTSMRHIDACLNNINGDHILYVGYGALTYTACTNIYVSTGTTNSDTVTGRSLLALFSASAGINLDSNINTRPSVIFRNNTDWKTTASYHTSGYEALCFETKQALTSIIFYNGVTYSEASDHWYNLINGVLIKNNCLAIGAGWANGVNPDYKLKVGGDIGTGGNIYISHSTNNNMNHDTSNPRIVFSENGSLAVGLVYTDYDSYRASKGLKVMDVDNSDPGNVWFEVLGYNYSSGYVKNGSNDNYVLLGGGGHKAESSLRVAYAASAGNAETLGGMPKNYGQAPFGTIPCIGNDGVMEIGRYIDYHYDNSGKYDFSTRLQTTGNYRNVVSLPSASGTLALTSDNVVSATRLQTPRTIWGQSFDGTADVNGTIYINNSDSSNGAIRLNNNVNSNARISAISDQVIFNTGNAIRFGETAWDFNQWAGLKYTHSNKTICLGIADGSVFNSNSTLSGGTLNLRAGISSIDLNSGTSIRGLPPDGSPYSSSITLRNTSIYLSSYGDISMSTGPGVIRLNSGYGGIKLSCLGNNASIDSEGFKVEASRGAYLNSKNSGNVYLCSGGGNVGIGTTSPSYKLDVNGNARMTSITLKTIAGTYYKLPVCLACGYVYDGLSSQGYRNQAISCNIRAEILMLDSNGKYVVWFPEIIDSNYDRQRMSLLLTGCAHGLSTDGTVKAVGTLTHRGTNLAIDVWTSDDDSINPSSFYFTIWSWL